MFGLGFAFPWVFLALGLWLLLPRRRGWPWRLAASALLIAALAQPTLERRGQNVAVLVEVSDSVGDNALVAASVLDPAELGQNRTVLFAGDARAFEELGEVPSALRRALRPGASDIARALQLARAEGAERVLLIASGRETAGDALAALPDVPIDVYPIETVANARLVSLIAPDEVSPGETVQAIAIVESDREAEMILRPRVGERELEPIRQRIPAGRTPVSFDFAADEVGQLTVSAALDVDFEQPAGDDSGAVEVAVTESPPILVINDPAAARLLTAQGFTVVEGGPEEVRAPFPYRAVVVRERAESFSQGQQSFLETFVMGGGGLMMTGGPTSFGLGGWYRTAVEEILPVDTALESEVEIPQVATVIVFDRSGSMRAERPTRISLARQGAIEMVELAYQDDLIGMIVFDHTYEWVFRPRPATERGKREMIEAISQINPAGGTIVGPAYEEALDALRELDAAVKHVILLTDGEFFDGTGRQGPTSMGPRPDFERMAAEGLADGITTTTIGLGEADFDVIERIARAGGGRFYGVTNTNELPQVFTSEAVVVPRASVREERFSPILHEHPFTAGLGAPPAIDAYVVTGLKEGAELLLEGLDGEPVLALSRQGLGRTAALTTDLNAWAEDFASWAELPALLGTAVRWLQAQPEAYSVSAVAAGGEVRVVVDAVRDGEYLSGERLDVRYGGAQVPLTQTGPGRYEATLQAGEGGSVVILQGGEIVARSTVGVDLSVDRDAAELFLREIARRSGGEVIDNLETYAPPPGREALTLWPYLALLGLVVFVLELAYRRFQDWRPSLGLATGASQPAPRAK